MNKEEKVVYTAKIIEKYILEKRYDSLAKALELLIKESGLGMVKVFAKTVVDEDGQDKIEISLEKPSEDD